MIYTPLTGKALQFAYQAHHGRTDKSGLPYIHHPLHLAEQMTEEYAAVCALLHDVVEDTQYTFDDLEKEDFPEEVLAALRLLTHDDSADYLDYIRAIRNNPIAAAVKKADLRHNSDLSRLASVTENDLSRAEKYKEALSILSTTQVVAALIRKDKRFLICQRPVHKARGLLWEFVGGKTEEGESKEDALIRECREELGITVNVHDVYMEVDHLYPDLTVHLTLFNASVAEGEIRLLEHNDAKWILPEEIPQYHFCPADETILERIIADSQKGEL